MCNDYEHVEKTGEAQKNKLAGGKYDRWRTGCIRDYCGFLLT